MIKIFNLFRWFRFVFLVAGMAFVGVLILPVTPVPWDWLRAMAQPGVNAEGAPDFIVMMGGGGIPSESGLTRSYKAAEVARMFPSAKVIVAMPMEPEEKLPGLIEQELIMRGVEASRLQREPHGRNTREQALEAGKLTGSHRGVIGLVTSPEHMTRVWRSFEKAGSNRLVAYPAWAEPIKADLDYKESDLGGFPLAGIVGGSDMVKYKYWDNLIILIKCARESVGLLYYRLMRWI